MILRYFTIILYGRFFYIESGHQPLSYLFNKAREILHIASSHIQRWALTLSTYQYSIHYKQGKMLSNADALSHLPRSITSLNCVPGDLVHLISHLSTTAISSDKIKEWTKRDPILLKVYCCISMG